MEKLYGNHIETLKHNYNEILERNSIANILVHSGSLEYRFLDDIPYPFQVNPHFNYFVPLVSNPDCFIFFQKNEKPTLYYQKVADYWHKEMEYPNGFWADSFDIKIISSPKDVFLDIKKKIKETVYIGPSANTFSEYPFKESNLEHLINEFHFVRAQKTPYEQLCIQEANYIATRAHLHAEALFRDGASEYEISLEYLKVMAFEESQLPYKSIIAQNENAATLHYTTYSRMRNMEKDRHSFLIDAGASFNGYAADITRTYSYKNDVFSEMISTFEKKQLQLIDNIKLDVSYTENQLASHRIVAEMLCEFGLSNASIDEILQKKITQYFYPHGVGHFLGLQVHDVGGYMKNSIGTQISPPKDHPFLRLTRTIKPGHVFTIEPGFYFIKPLLKKLNESEHSSLINWREVYQFQKYGGIRVEDDICIHEDKVENFTRNSFHMVKL